MQQASRSDGVWNTAAWPCPQNEQHGCPALAPPPFPTLRMSTAPALSQHQSATMPASLSVSAMRSSRSDSCTRAPPPAAAAAGPAGSEATGTGCAVFRLLGEPGHHLRLPGEELASSPSSLSLPPPLATAGLAAVEPRPSLALLPADAATAAARPSTLDQPRSLPTLLPGVLAPLPPAGASSPPSSAPPLPSPASDSWASSASRPSLLAASPASRLPVATRSTVTGGRDACSCCCCSCGGGGGGARCCPRCLPCGCCCCHATKADRPRSQAAEKRWPAGGPTCRGMGEKNQGSSR